MTSQALTASRDGPPQGGPSDEAASGRAAQRRWQPRVSVLVNSMLIAWMALTNPAKDIASILKSFSLDPFATAISQLPPWNFASACGYDPSAPEQDLAISKLDNSSSMPKCVFVNEPFEWHGDQPLRHPWSKTVIYETHVRGFTIHPKSGVDHPGTYRGLMEKIPYFKELGVTAVELMPVMEFNDHESTGINPQTGQPLGNYWGYDPVAFFAPKASYSSAGGSGQQKREFKEMVRAFHLAGIEVIPKPWKTKLVPPGWEMNCPNVGFS